MVHRRDVLVLIGERTKEGRPVTVADLAGEFGLSLEAAGMHLRRAWRNHLIIPVNGPRLHPDRMPGRLLERLRFQLSERGRERLAWYARQDPQDPVSCIARKLAEILKPPGFY